LKDITLMIDDPLGNLKDTVMATKIDINNKEGKYIDIKLIL